MIDCNPRKEIGIKALIRLQSISLISNYRKNRKRTKQPFITCLSFDYVQIIEIDTLLNRFKGTPYSPPPHISQCLTLLFSSSASFEQCLEI